jgi:putative oxidoreductase
MDYLAFHYLNRYRETGILLLRLGIGFMLIIHGYDKLFGGPAKWESLGENMGNVGIEFAPVFWGFMAAFSEAVGGLLVMLGLLFRPACLLLFITMIVAAARHIADAADLTAKEKLMEASHPIELAVVFLSLIFIGPGKYSLDRWILPPRVDKPPV